MPDTPRPAAGNTRRPGSALTWLLTPSDLPSTQPWASGLENRWANCRILPQGSAYYGETGALEWGGGEGVGEDP